MAQGKGSTAVADAPDTLPSDFFDKKQQTGTAPDTLPANFFDKKQSTDDGMYHGEEEPTPENNQAERVQKENFTPRMRALVASGAAKVQPQTQFEKDRPGEGISLKGAGSAFWDKLKQMVPSDPTGGHSIFSKEAWLGEGPTFDPAHSGIAQAGSEAAHEYERARKAGSGVIPSIATAGVVGTGSLLGASNKEGEEQAQRGEGGKIIGSAAAPAAAAAVAPLVGSALEAGGRGITRVLPSKGDIALRFRDWDTGKLGPGTEAASRLAGAGLGHLASYAGFPLVGELGGYAIGPRVAEAIIPKLPTDIPVKPGQGGAPLPSIDEFYQQRAEDLVQRGKEQGKIDVANEKKLTAVEEARQKELADQEKLKQQDAESRMRREREQRLLDKEAERQRALNPLAGLQTTAQPVGSATLPVIGGAGPSTTTAVAQPELPGVTAPIGPKPKPEPSRIVSPTEGEAVRTGNEGRGATWTNEAVLEEAAKGNREGIRQAILRKLPMPPNVRYVMGDPDTARAVLNPREVTRFTPEGEPIRDKSNPFTTEPTARIPTIARTPRPGTIPNIAETPRTAPLQFPGPMPETPETLPAAVAAGERPQTITPKAATPTSATAPTLLEPMPPFGIKPVENAKPIMPAEMAGTAAEAPAVPAEPEPQEVKIKGITSEEPKGKSGKRAKAEPIEKRYSHSTILDAEGLLASESGASQAGERPGRYYDESEAGDVRLRSRGAQTKGGDWRGVKSGRNMFPFLRENPDVTPGAIEKALRNKDSAAYARLIEKAVDFNRRNSPAYDFLRSLGENPDAEPPEPVAEEAQPTPEPAKPTIPNIAKGETGIIPGMEQDVAKQQAGAAKVAGENLTAEANKPKDISEAAGRMETRSPLFRGTEASPQKEIFGNAPATPSANTPPPAIEPVLKETGWNYEGKNNLGLHTLQEPGTKIKLELWDREMNPDFVRRKIAEKERQYGVVTPKAGEPKQSTLADVEDEFKRVSKEHEQAKKDYRAKKIGDAEFMASQKKQDAVLKRWEALRGEGSEEVPF